MTDLSEDGVRLLEILVDRLPAISIDPFRGFMGYREAHTLLGLQMHGTTWGISLKNQGLDDLAQWAKDNKLPAITGLIVDESDNFAPSSGYFELFKQLPTAWTWWHTEVSRAKAHDWSEFLSAGGCGASDLAPPSARVTVSVSRVIRNTAVAQSIKRLHNYECQICGHFIQLPDGSRYAEGHHLRPLGTPHDGPDVRRNIVCLCPNHHAELDLGIRPLAAIDLRRIQGHVIADEFIDYHNDEIHAKRLKS